MTQEQAAELLQKYLTGEASESESRQIEEWYGSLPLADPLAEERKQQIAEEMRVHIQQSIRPPGRKKHLLYSPWLKIAALLLMALAIGLIFRNRIPGGAAMPERTVYTNAHERKIITLSDGSKVSMQPSSELSYPARFLPGNRVLKLVRGDAFFSIAHDSRRPFTVRLKDAIEVKVLGTSFNIHNVENEDLLKVTVATGKVAVQKGSALLGTLTMGQELSFHKRKTLSSVYRVLQPRIVKLSFEDSSLEEVIRKLEYVYTIRIQVSNPQFLKLKSRAEFNSGQQPAEILDILCSLHHLRFSQSKNHKSFRIYQ